ncbi:MAG: hypothetical protein A2798_00095 [Candidatus Levybacteria bacterium RIFCSPHIGHO2_01_FULL_37_17]|nr:MAG: hypothetical protein A2798_00095 [Candidatus Levybacteria bacterium RIFCSPHIGHO2_01_FULL_37_17]OGH36504.1 MAG: hypothetical protein A2959_03270 [Candidatus Levybacteria bacterium RIFCSPLOWO2_01_FULL_38_23]
MKSVKQVLKSFNPLQDKYISRDFQQFGIWLAEEMEDYKNRGMWIRLAKINHRSVLEQCLSFVKDSNADNKIALFLWKLKEIKNQKPDLKPDDKSFQK